MAFSMMKLSQLHFTERKPQFTLKTSFFTQKMVTITASFSTGLFLIMIQGGDFVNQAGTGGYAAKWYGYCNGQAQDSSDGCAQSSWTMPDELITV